MTRTVGFGTRYLLTRELLADGTVRQRGNPGEPEDAGPWRPMGRYEDLDVERARLLSEGWEIGPV